MFTPEFRPDDVNQRPQRRRLYTPPPAVIIEGEPDDRPLIVSPEQSEDITDGSTPPRGWPEPEPYNWLEQPD
jgi:hypothetical protein